MEEMKKCSKCECEKPIAEFGKYRRKSGHIATYPACLPCKREADRVYGKSEAGKVRNKRSTVNYQKTDKYSAAMVRYRLKEKEKMLAIQQGATCPVLCRRCASCGSAKVYRGSVLGKYKHATDVMDCCREGRVPTKKEVICKVCERAYIGAHSDAMCQPCATDATRKAESEYRRGEARARKHGVAYERVVRSIVYERDSYTCYCCGVTVVESKEYQPNRATIDHVVPMSKGGAHTYDNTKTMCVLCNSRKSDKPAEDIVPVLRSGEWKPTGHRHRGSEFREYSS